MQNAWLGGIPEPRGLAGGTMCCGVPRVSGGSPWQLLLASVLPLARPVPLRPEDTWNLCNHLPAHLLCHLLWFYLLSTFKMHFFFWRVLALWRYLVFNKAVFELKKLFFSKLLSCSHFSTPFDCFDIWFVGNVSQSRGLVSIQKKEQVNVSILLYR